MNQQKPKVQDNIQDYTTQKEKKYTNGDIVKVKSKNEHIGKVIYEYNGFTVDVMNMDLPYGRVSLINNFMEVIRKYI